MENIKRYRITNSEGKYLSFDFKSNPRFFEGIDMSYTFTLDIAKLIVELYSHLNLKIEKD